MCEVLQQQVVYSKLMGISMRSHEFDQKEHFLSCLKKNRKCEKKESVKFLKIFSICRSRHFSIAT